MPHLHVIGVCGTAMAGIAALAKAAGFHVTGSDAGVYPPMSDFLLERGIPILEPFRPENLEPAPDLVLVGNAISRGNAELEAVLERGIPYYSGPEWLKEHLLAGRHPIVVAGTHGKTTTSSLVAWLLEYAGEKPGFLIGGIPRNFGEGARFPGGPWVVLEGDEYDTAFWDKGAKFLHYRPRTLVLNNLEYDHADIYPDMESIRRQFRLLLRTVPASGVVFGHGDDVEVEELLTRHVFCRVIRFGLSRDYPYGATLDEEQGSHWTLWREGQPLFQVEWGLLGRHNVLNGLAAAAVALHHGVPSATVGRGLNAFQGVARRLDRVALVAGVAIYDDFAHHPTAIATTLEGLAAASGQGRVWVVLEPRSNTMRRRIHQQRLPEALGRAHRVIIARPSSRGLAPDEVLDVEAIAALLNEKERDCAFVVDGAGEAVQLLVEHLHSGDMVVVMSNGGFDGIHGRLTRALAAKGETGSGGGS